jgi:hypothetical protein
VKLFVDVVQESSRRGEEKSWIRIPRSIGISELYEAIKRVAFISDNREGNEGSRYANVMHDTGNKIRRDDAKCIVVCDDMEAKMEQPLERGAFDAIDVTLNKENVANKSFFYRFPSPIARTRHG